MKDIIIDEKKYELVDKIRNELTKDIVLFFLVKEIQMNLQTIRKLIKELELLNEEEHNCIDEEKYLLNLSDERIKQNAINNNGIVGSFLKIPIRLVEGSDKYIVSYFSKEELKEI